MSVRKCCPLIDYLAAAFQTWFPDLYAEYKSTMKVVQQADPSLQTPIPRSVFPGLTVNFGGRVTSYRHRDSNNLACGVCAITPLGKFDHQRSAQLVLEEPKVVLEVPPMAVAFILSASCTHSNLPLADGETRISFTQYAAGPLFRYAQNLCMTEETLRLVNPSVWAANQKLKGSAWIRGVSLLPTIEKLVEY